MSNPSDPITYTPSTPESLVNTDDQPGQANLEGNLPNSEDSSSKSPTPTQTVTMSTNPSPEVSVLTDSHSSVPVLTEDNYSSWHQKIESYLMMKNLDGIVDGTESVPTNPTQLAAYEIRSKFLAGLLRSKLSDRITELLVNESNRKNPIELWKTIVGHFASTKARNRGRVFAQLFTLSCNGSDLQGFMTSVRKTLNNLSATVVKTDDKMIAYFILHLLPEEDYNLKTMITHGAELVDEKLSVNSVINQIQQHVNNKKVSLNTTSSSAYAVQRNGPPRRYPVSSRGRHNPETAHSADQCLQLHPHLKFKN